MAWFVAIALLSIAAWTLSRSGRFGRVEHPSSGTSSESNRGKTAVDLDDSPRTDSRESGAQVAANAAASIRAVEPDLAHVRGSVIDTEGTPCGELLVEDANHPGTALAWTAADGSFEASTRVGACLCATGRGLVTVLQHRIRTREESQAGILDRKSVV